MAPTDIQRLHERMDEIFASLGERDRETQAILTDLRLKMAAISEHCPNCRDMVEKHEQSLHGIDMKLAIIEAQATTSWKALTIAGMLVGGICTIGSPIVWELVKRWI